MPPCPCSAPAPIGAIPTTAAPRIATLGLAAAAIGALVSARRYDWAAPGFLLGGAAGLGLGYILTR